MKDIMHESHEALGTSLLPEWADSQMQGLAGQSRGIWLGDLPQSLRLSLLRITIDLAAAC